MTSCPNEVICLSQMTAKQGKVDQLKKALLSLIDPTRQEPGCLAYELWEEKGKKGFFIMYERFESNEALTRHIQSPHIQSFIKNEYSTCVDSHWDAGFDQVSK